MVLVALSVGVIGAVMLVMAVGAMFGRRCLRGSCGGPELLGPDGESLACADCPNRQDSDAQPTPASR